MSLLGAPAHKFHWGFGRRILRSGRHASWLLTSILVCVGCGGAGTDTTTSTTVAPARPVTQSDLEIAQLLYSDSKRTPDGFYQDAPPTLQGYVATMHLKSTDLPGAANQEPHELCTDDWNTALTWSDETASSERLSTLMETNTTDRYFEFGRERNTTPQGYVRARVYKCSYLNRDNVDLNLSQGNAGTLNERPLTAAELQQLSEYLWRFTTYNNYGHVVLKSSGAPTATGLQHTLVIASLATTADGCNRIDVIDWTHTMDAQTGALQLSIADLWDFSAKSTGGYVELCN